MAGVQWQVLHVLVRAGLVAVHKKQVGASTFRQLLLPLLPLPLPLSLLLL